MKTSTTARLASFFLALVLTAGTLASICQEATTQQASCTSRPVCFSCYECAHSRPERFVYGCVGLCVGAMWLSSV